jgi:hypothetical protein
MVRCEQRVQQSSLTGPAPALPMHPGLQTGRHTTICGHFTSPDRQAASNGLYLYSCGYRTGPRHNFTSHLCGVDSSHLPTHHSTGCDHGAEVCADDTKHMHAHFLARRKWSATPHSLTEEECTDLGRCCGTSHDVRQGGFGLLGGDLAARSKGRHTSLDPTHDDAAVVQGRTLSNLIVRVNL